MREIKIKQVDAFTAMPLEGNPAGVVTRADGISDHEMQAIAREMNCSETAFVLPSTQARIRLRYFTPAQEVDLCGHATIAALHALQEEGLAAGPLLAETRVGVLDLEAGQDGMHWMRQDTPRLRAWDEDVQDVLELLGLAPEDLDPKIPLGLAYTGLWALLVPLRDLQALRAARPDAGALAVHNKRRGIVSTHLFCGETELPGSTLHARDFSPAAGVAEDPHTGTASGALGAYLVAQGAIAPGRHVFEQGWTVGRPGRIHVEVAPGAAWVRVGGEAVTVLTGSLLLP